jgi:fimbrial chaperone protein
VRFVLLGTMASVAALLLSPALSFAGTFSITPVRLDLAAGAGTGVVTLRNQEDQPVVVQAEVHLWEQVDGADRLSVTRDLLVTPAVFTVPPGGAQIVRIALRRDAAVATELSYRLVLTEVPQPGASGMSGLNFALQMSLPVFVAGRDDTAPDLQWSASQTSDGALKVTARNAGNAHARVLDLQVQPLDVVGRIAQPTGAAYVLPGQSRSWTLTLDPQGSPGGGSPPGRVRLKGIAEDGDFSEELAVAPW